MKEKKINQHITFTKIDYRKTIIAFRVPFANYTHPCELLEDQKPWLTISAM